MNYPDNAAPYLDQSSRFELAPIASPCDHDDDPAIVTISSPPDGFRMPSLAAIRAHDARLAARDGYAPPAPMDDGDDDEQDDEQDLREQVAYKRRDSMREHSFRLPSQGTRSDVRETLRSMNMAWQD